MTFEHLCMGCMKEKGKTKICPHCQWEKTSEPESPHHLPPHSILIDRYIIGKILRENHLGTIYLGLDIEKSQKLAIREFFPKDLVTREPGSQKVTVKELENEALLNLAQEQFLQESLSLSEVNLQPGTAQTFTALRENGTAYRIMEYVEGINFNKFLEKNGGQISFNLLCKIITPVMHALEAAHKKGVVHYGINPDNIIISQNSVGILVSFSSTYFSMGSKRHQYPSLVQEGFSALELYQKKGTPGTWSDVYSLAATMYQAITGKVPSAANKRVRKDTLVRPSRLGKNLPLEAETALIRGLSVRHGTRFQNADDFKEAVLEDFLAKTKEKSSTAIDAFAEVTCPHCGTVNDVLVTDLEVGAPTCISCYQPITTQEAGFEAEPGSLAEPPSAPRAVEVETETAETTEVSSKLATPLAILKCSQCGFKNEIALDDITTGVRCAKCLAPLEAGRQAARLEEPDIEKSAARIDISQLSTSTENVVEAPPPTETLPTASEPGAESAPLAEAAAQEEVKEEEAVPPPVSLPTAEVTEPEKESAVFEDVGAPREITIEAQKGIPAWVWAAAAVIVLAALGAFFWQQEKEEKTIAASFQPSHLEEGDSKFKHGDFENALENYRKALQQHPDDEYIKHQITICEEYIQGAQAAAGELADGPENDNIPGKNLLKKADSLFTARNFTGARALYETALGERPGDSHITTRLKEIENKSRKPPKAKPRRITVHPDDDLKSIVDRASPNSTLIFTTGIFAVSQTLLLNKSLTFRGNGPKQSLLIVSSGGNFVEVSGNGTFSAAGIGFEYQGRKGGNIVSVINSRVNFDNCSFKGAIQNDGVPNSGHGLLLDQNSNGSVKNCTFTGNHIGVGTAGNSRGSIHNCDILQNRVGVQIGASSRPVIDNCRIRKNSKNGIEVAGNGQPTIENNKIMDNRMNGISFATRKYTGATRNNEITNNGESGIVLSGKAQPNLEGNTIESNKQVGIFYKDQSRGTARQNKIRKNSYGGIIVANNAMPIIEKNEIRNNRNDGIEVKDKARPTIDGNEITKNNGDGISLTLSSSGGYLRNNICTGNQGYGISILSRHRPSLSNNTTSGNYEGAIYEEGK